jgi:hypothetical protein
LTKGAISTLVTSELDEVMQTLRNVFVAATETGQAVMLLMPFNDCPVQAQEPM